MPVAPRPVLATDASPRLCRTVWLPWSWPARAVATLALTLATLACTKDDEPAQASGPVTDGGAGTLPTCAIGMRLSGEVETTRSVESDATCAPVDSLGTGIDVIYVTLESVKSATLRISDVAEAQTGNFPASMNFVLNDDRRYVTAPAGCNVNIEEHRPTGGQSRTERRTYQVAGRGTCGPALPEGDATGSIAISDLAFRIAAVWRD